MSAAQRNQLRAAPFIRPIKSASTAKIEMQNISSGLACPGYFTGKADLPEAYYFYPVGGNNNGVWDPTKWQTDYDDGTNEAGRYNYISTEGNTGHVDIPANIDPFDAETIIEVPDLGIHLDLANDTGTIASAPKSIRVTAPSGAWIEIAVKTSAYPDVIDWAVDDNNIVKVQAAAAAVTTGYSSSTYILSILTTDSIKSIYDKLVTQSEASAIFTITAPGAPADLPTTGGVLVSYSPRSGGGSFTGAVPFIPDCYKVIVEANDYTFQTGNGFTRSSHFFSRDVAVGDYIKWQVELDTGAVQCESQIIDITYDMTTPVVGEVI